MARKSIEESIREVDTAELKYRLEHKRENYAEEVLAFMKD